jgi:hypothetical protein
MRSTVASSPFFDAKDNLVRRGGWCVLKGYFEFDSAAKLYKIARHGNVYII